MAKKPKLTITEFLMYLIVVTAGFIYLSVLLDLKQAMWFYVGLFLTTTLLAIADMW